MVQNISAIFFLVLAKLDVLFFSKNHVDFEALLVLMLLDVVSNSAFIAHLVACQAKVLTTSSWVRIPAEEAIFVYLYFFRF